MVRSVLAHRSTGSGFDLPGFGCRCSDGLCIFCLYDAIYVYISFDYVLFFTGARLVVLAVDAVD